MNRFCDYLVWEFVILSHPCTHTQTQFPSNLSSILIWPGRTPLPKMLLNFPGQSLRSPVHLQTIVVFITHCQAVFFLCLFPLVYWLVPRFSFLTCLPSDTAVCCSLTLPELDLVFGLCFESVYLSNKDFTCIYTLLSPQSMADSSGLRV